MRLICDSTRGVNKKPPHDKFSSFIITPSVLFHILTSSSGDSGKQSVSNCSTQTGTQYDLWV